MGIALIFALALALAALPGPVDRWAERRGAQPETLASLAAVALLGIAAAPVAFAICTGTLAIEDGGRDGLDLLAATGLLLVALAGGRAVARMLRIRRRWVALARVARALEPAGRDGPVTVLPLEELLAFSSGTRAFVSQGLLDRLSPEQRAAVIEHEREHAQRRHGRLSAAARAISHGAFGVRPARDAAGALDRELDVLADRGAAARAGAPALRGALAAVAAATHPDQPDGAVEARMRRLAAERRPLVDATVRLLSVALVALVLASICLSIHPASLALGAATCALLIAGFASLAWPLAARREPGGGERAEGDD